MTTYTQEIGDKVCQMIADGLSLRAIAKQDGMPSPSLVCKWLAEDENAAFREQYTRAREVQADGLFDEILDIADSQEGDCIKKPDGTELVNHDVIARAKLRVDARKWMAGKLRPKVYGDKVISEVSGPNGGAIEVEFDSARESIARRLAGLTAASAANPNPERTD